MKVYLPYWYFFKVGKRLQLVALAYVRQKETDCHPRFAKARDKLLATVKACVWLRQQRLELYVD